MASVKNLTTTTLHSMTWTTAATIITSVLQIGYTAVMARMLPPAAFGLVALAGVVLRFGGYFAQMGMAQAIIQKPELTEEDIRAAFTSSALLGGFFTAAMVLGAPLTRFVFDQPEVVPLVRTLALGSFVAGLISTAMSLLRRNMQFRTLAIMDVVAYVLGYGGVGVVLAWQGFGVWSLIWATLSQGMILGVLAYAVTRHSVRLYFSWAHYRPLLSYGARISFTSFLEFITGSLDTMVIGRVLGTALLGIYNRAYMLISLPLYLITNSVAKVIFPAFSQLQANLGKLRAVYLASITLVAAVVLPLGAGMAVAAPELVRSLLGPDWDASVPVLRVMSVPVALSMITMFAGVMCDARAQLNQKIVVNIVTLVALVACFWLLRGYGLLGFAWSLLLNELLRMVLFTYLMNRDLAISYSRQLVTYLPGLWHAAAVGGALALVRWAIAPLQLPVFVALGLLAFTGAIVLAIVMLALPLPLLRHEMHRVLSRLHPTGAVGRQLNRYMRFLEPSAESVPAEFHNASTSMQP
ncbi:lipopolysaccharide biosynthesis protein [Hymenobacter elongatus]|uniref:Lipopolysaccharide biosynthesis protein n=1 Tax=Hymenobacter elongatus TaxID=877208 RepID=A0A4Z0PGA1_9BACT|nr:lipopolysaccharide biosynthesis protein [Hymenobacter elongatus]TGE14037.1 lipopolysaccharide biosynthesis protein [Hymenobacter elongatus]